VAKLRQRIQRFFDFNLSGRENDLALVIIVGAIVMFGIVMLTSASGPTAYREYQDAYRLIKHQLVGIAVGIAALLFFANVDYHFWRKYAFWMLVISIFLLFLVFVPGLGVIVNGSRSWIEILGQRVQPSEFVKLTLLIYLAAWLEHRGKKLEDFSQGLGPFVIVLSIIGVLMMLQPDFGTMFIIGMASLIAYYVGGGKLGHILIIGLIGIIGLGLLVESNDYQKNRFRCLLDENFSPQEHCYQIRQSLIAIGSGGFWGRGFGASRQKFLFLPEVSGDSIFAIVGEELGFIFSILLLAAFLFLFYRTVSIGRGAPDAFGRVLAIGIGSWITVQALVNIGGMVNIIPMTGVPLPLVSYGGSAIMATLAAVGVLLNISKQAKSYNS